MRVKNILLIVICVFSFFAAAGQETKKCLVLLKNDESTVFFPLSEEPKITFEGEDFDFHFGMVIESGNQNVKLVTFEQNKMEIKDISQTGIKNINHISDIELVGKEIIVETSATSVPYSIVNLHGRIVESGNLPSGLSSVSLEGLQAGVYIISINTQTFKISVK